MHRSITVYKWKLSKTVLNKYVVMVLMWETGGDGIFQWRKCYYGLWTLWYSGQKWRFKVKMPQSWICFLENMQLFTSQDVDWSGVDYLWIIVMFLSAVWTLILTAPIHCRASIAETLMQRHISPNLMKKQTHLHLGWLHSRVSKCSAFIYVF